jgi:hypothetical protein
MIAGSKWLRPASAKPCLVAVSNIFVAASWRMAVMAGGAGSSSVVVCPGAVATALTAAVTPSMAAHV